MQRQADDINRHDPKGRGFFCVARVRRSSRESANMDDLDSPWKEALDVYIEQALALLFPHVHAGFNWSRGQEFLEQKLQAIVRDREQGQRAVDKLVNVWRGTVAKNGF